MVRIILLRFLESYFRHPLLSLLPLVIALAAGSYFVSTAPPEYEATGRLYVDKESLLASLTSTSNDGNWWVSAAQLTTNELSELAVSRAFTRSVIQKTTLEKNMAAGEKAIDETFTYYRKAIQFTARGDKLVEITATSDDPKLAYEMVVATMDAYLQWKLNADYRESTSAQSFFSNLLQPYQDQVDTARSELVAYLQDHPAPVRGDRPPDEELEVERLRANLQRAEDRLAKAQENEENARFSQMTSDSVTKQTYLVVDQPTMPSEPTTSLKALAQDLAIFAVAGLFLSFALVAAGALLDRTLRFPIDVRHSLSLPLLGMIPRGVAQAAAPVKAGSTATPDEGAAQADPSVLQPQV